MRLAAPVFERPIAESTMLVRKTRSSNIETLVAFSEQKHSRVH